MADLAAWVPKASAGGSSAAASTTVGGGLFLGGAPCADNVQIARLDESDGVITQSTSRSIHRLPRGVSAIRLVYWNGRVSYPSGPPFGEGSTSVGTALHDLKVAVERAGGTIDPVFFGGRRNPTYEAGGFLVSDPIAITEADGVDIWVRTRASAGAGIRWPYQRNLRSELGEGIENSTDKADSGVIAAVTAAGYVPVAIIAVNSIRPSVAMQGDSIVWGVGDTDIEPNKGFMRRALARQFGYVALARSGDRAEYVSSPGIYKARLLLALGCRYAISNFGINDVGGVSGPAGALGTRTAAQLEADWLTIATMHDRGGVVWGQCTLTPYTSSSDNWTTVAGQTVQAGAERAAANDWLRDGCPIDPATKLRVATGTVGALRTRYWDGFKWIGSRGIGHPIGFSFEVADFVESSRNSGKWKTDEVTAFKYVNNDALGIHPSQFGHAEAAKGVPTGAFV